MDIVLGFDNNYATYSRVLIASICENNSNRQIMFHVLTDGLLPEKEKAVWSVVQRYNQRVCFYKIDIDLLKDCPIRKGSRLNIAAFYRILMPVILPTTLKKVLYLDCDIIVRHNLDNLWNTDIDNFAVGVVLNEDTDDVRVYNRLQYDYKLGCFNSGVMLANLEYWRKHDVSGRVLKFIRQYPERLRAADQCAFNYVLKNEKKNIPLKYNVQNEFLYIDSELRLARHYWDELYDAIKDPYILHYTCVLKPWFIECNHPFKDEYAKYEKLVDKKIKRKRFASRKQRIMQIIRKAFCVLGILSPANNSLYKKVELI